MTSCTMASGCAERRSCSRKGRRRILPSDGICSGQSFVASAWAALMLKIPPQDMAVTDLIFRFFKAAKAVWPTTRIQRCTFHVANQVGRCTTRRLVAGSRTGFLRHRQQALGGWKRRSRRMALEYSAWCTRWGIVSESSRSKTARRLTRTSACARPGAS